MFAAGLLRRRGAGDRHRGTGADHLWRPGLCPPRDRPQPLCRRQPQDQRRDFRRGTGRNPRQYQRTGGIFGPWGSEIGPGRCPGPQFLLARRHLSAGHQGAPGGGDPFQARSRNPADRAFPSSGSGRHVRTAPTRCGDADRDRARCRDLYAEGSQQSRLRHPDDAVDRRHRRNRRAAEGAVSQHLRPAQGRHLLRHHQPSARGEKGGAGGRRPDRGRCAELVEFATPARSRRTRGLPGLGAGAARRRSRLEHVRGHQEPRHHRGRLGAGSDRRRDHGCVRRALRIACGDGLGRGRERILSVAALAAARRSGIIAMAVYTDVAADELAAFLGHYDIGELLSYKGIAEGVENSNFLLHTSAGDFLLTLYEKRVAKSELPFFLGLMTYLASRGIICPEPLKNKSGDALSELAGRPAVIINFLEGIWPRKPNLAHCAGVGQALAKMHLAGRDFPMSRANALSVSGWRPLFDQAASRADELQHGLRAFIGAELYYLEGGVWPKNLPQGVIHADLFPDNVFFLGERLSGLIDFTFACNDTLAYDVAICLNAWCFESDCSFNVTKARAFLGAYGRERPLSDAEQNALPLLARGAALRFLLTRLVDFLHVPSGALVRPKDPLEYARKLRFQQGVKSMRDYGVAASGLVA